MSGAAAEPTPPKQILVRGALKGVCVVVVGLGLIVEKPVWLFVLGCVLLRDLVLECVLFVG
jgi:hypothetical protein